MSAAERAALQRMTETEIRRAQDLVNAQIVLAYERGNTEALAKLRDWEDSYAHEMLRRL